MKEGESQGGLPKRTHPQESPEEHLLNAVIISEIVLEIMDPKERAALEAYDEMVQSKTELFGRELTSQEVDEIQNSVEGAKDALDKWTGLFEYYANKPADRFEI